MRLFVQAFTLLEVVLVVGCLSILAGLTFSFFPRSILSSSSAYELLKADQGSLALGLLKAREYAVLRQQEVLLCGGVDTCDGNWSAGWHVRNKGQTSLVEHYPPGANVLWRGFPVSRDHIQFLKNGHSGYQNGTFILCREGWQTSIVLNQSGRFYRNPVVKTAEGELSCTHF